MTVEDWNTSLGPKVQGSWNLHTLLPKGMDFFICLSSTAGILGGPATANYAAGNTFLDALAEYRILTGEKAIGLDLGWMKTAGVVAENANLEYVVRISGSLKPISQEELYALLDYYCNPNLPLLTLERGRVIIGLETPAAMRANLQSMPHWTGRRNFRFLHRISLEGSSSGGSDIINYADLFREASSLDNAVQLVIDALVKKLSKALSLSEDDIEVDKALHVYGVDSLLALELRNYFKKEFGADIPVFDIAGGATFREVGMTVTKNSQILKLA
jgi:acyl carrier protein